MPHEGFADPVTSDGTGFRSNMPVSELTEHDTQAIEASVVSSAPPIAETVDGVTHKTQLTPIEPNGARGLEPPDSNRLRFEGQPAKGSRPPRVKKSWQECLFGRHSLCPTLSDAKT